MADKHSYDVTIGGETYAVDSDTPLTDTQAYQYAKQQHEANTPPLTIAEKNAKARENMAKQHEGRTPPSFAHEFVRGVEEGTTPGDAGMARTLLGAVARTGPGRAMRGSEQIGAGDYKKGAHNLIAGGGTTAAMMFAPEIVANPVTAAAALALGTGGDMAGRKVAELAGGDEDTQNLAGDVAGLATGAMGAKLGHVIPAGPAVRFVGSELARPGGIQGVVGKGLQGAADLGSEISARARGPIGDVFAPGTADSAALAATKNAALTDSDKLVAKTIEDQHAEANRTNKRLLDEAARAAKKATPAKSGGVKPFDVAQMLRDRLPGVAGQDADVAIPDRGNRPAAAPQGTGQERTVDMPLWQQQQAMENGQILTGRTPVEPPPDARANTPTHRQEGAGGRGQEAPPELDTLDLSKVPAGKNARPGAADLAQVEDAGGPNASGESAASREALSRLDGMKARGEEFVVKKGNTIRKLLGPEAVDYTPQEGETFGIRAKDGTFRPLSEGEIKTALTGNRKAGAMPIAMRRALFNELTKRSGK